jgi:hypothetical protein
MHKVFPHIKTGESRPAHTCRGNSDAETTFETEVTSGAEATSNVEVTSEASNPPAEQRRPRKRSRLETLLKPQTVQAQPVDALTRSLWFRAGRSINHSIRTTRRKIHAQTLKALLTSELRSKRAVNAIVSKAAIVSATLLSIFITVDFLILADSQNMKASETHLAAAQIIGAALALVLSLSIIPAQRAAELFSISVLKLFAKDHALITVLACGCDDRFFGQTLRPRAWQARAVRQRAGDHSPRASRCNFNCRDFLPAITPKSPLSGRAMGVLQIARWWNIAPDLPDVSNVFAGKASMPATPCYFAWGCFQYFSWERA